MVKGYMDALPQYSQVGIPAECIEKISEYVNSWVLAALPCGKYVIDGERIYVSIQEYETKSYGDCRFDSGFLTPACFIPFAILPGIAPT